MRKQEYQPVSRTEDPNDVVDASQSVNDHSLDLKTLDGLDLYDRLPSDDDRHELYERLPNAIAETPFNPPSFLVKKIL